MALPLASGYLATTRSVLVEAQHLESLLRVDPDAAEVAIDDLATAAGHQDATGDASLGFTSRTTEAAPEGTTEEVLAGALAELQVANVLMAAGQATGEGGVAGDPSLLARAIGELDDTLTALDRGALDTGRLGFAVPASAPRQSPDDTTALARLQEDVETMVGTVVEDSGEVVSGLVKKLGELVPEQITEAMSRLGEHMESLPKVGRVLRIGLRKLEKVLNLLSRLVGKDNGDRVREKVQGLWERIRSGEMVGSILDDILDLEGTRTHVAATLPATGVARAKVDLAAQELADLRSRFDGALKTVKAVAEAAGLALVVAGVVALVVVELGALLGAITALIYLAIIGAVILLGMDYLDSRLDLRRVEGVRSIVNRLSA